MNTNNLQPEEKQPTPQHITESIVRRTKKKAKSRKMRRMTKSTPTTKNCRQHKLPGYGGCTRAHTSKSWRK